MVFDKVFEFVMELEGGYKLHTNPTEETDTYAGIYRAAHPSWTGWTFIDEGEIPDTSLVKDFYREMFWDKIPLEDGLEKAMVFEYGVNAGLSTGVKTLQSAAGVTPDGDIGPISKEAVANKPLACLLSEFSLLRVAKYVSLANKNPNKYGVYLRGWMNRVLTASEWFKNEFV